MKKNVIFFRSSDTTCQINIFPYYMFMQFLHIDWTSKNKKGKIFWCQIFELKILDFKQTEKLLIKGWKNMICRSQFLMNVFLPKNSIWRKRFDLKNVKSICNIPRICIFCMCCHQRPLLLMGETIMTILSWVPLLNWNPSDFLVNFLPKINITPSIQEPINWAFDSFWNPFFHFLVLIKILPRATNNFSFFHCCTSFFHNCFWK